MKDQQARRSKNLDDPLDDVVNKALVKRLVYTPLEAEANTYDDKLYDVKK